MRVIAIRHIPIKIIQRSKGKSAVAAAAYRSGTKLTNEWDGLTHDYTHMKKTQKQENKQSKKVKFIVIREFSGDKTMQEAFEQLIERQTCEHFEEWLERKAS